MASSLAGVVGALRVSLGLDSANFQSGLKQAQSKLGSFGSGMKAGFAKLASVAKVAFLAVAAAGAAAFAALSTGAIILAGQAKEITQMSQAFGMTTDAYQGLVLGARKFGVEQDKVNDILKDTSDRLGEFIQTGGGPLKDFMDKIATPAGVSANDLFQLPPEERLVKMVSLMEAAGLSVDEQRFHMEALAGDFSKLIPLLANGGKLSKEMTAEFEKQGLILSGKTISSLTSFKSSLDTIGGTMQGWGNILISGMSEPLAEITGKLSNFLKNSDAIRNVFAVTGQVVGQVITFISNGISSIIGYFQGMNTEGGRIGSIFNSIAAIWANVVRGWEAAYPVFSALFGYIGQALYFVGDLFLTQFDNGLKAVSLIYGVFTDLAVMLYNVVGAAITWVGDTFTSISDKAKYAFELMVAYGSGAVSAIKGAFSALPAAMGDMMYQAANAVIGAIGGMVDGAINLMKKGLDSLGDYSPIKLETSNLANSMKVDNPYAGAAKEAGKGFGETFNAEANKVIVKNKFKAGANALLGMVPTGWISGGNTPTVPASPTTPIMPTNTVKPPVTPPSTGGGSSGGAGAGDADAKAQTKAYEDLQKRVASLGQTFGMTALQKKIFDEQQKVGTAASAEAVAALVTQEDRLTKFKEVMDSIGDSFTSNFEGILTGTKSFKDALGGFLSDIASMLAKSALNQLWGSLTGGAGGWLSGLVGGGGAGATTIVPYALGTSGAANGMALVGERGPELMSLRAGTKIIPNNKTNQILQNAGQGGNTRIEVSLGDDLEARILAAAKNNSISIVNSNNKQQDDALPSKIDKYKANPRYR